jgi:hypothetical protein
MCGEDYQYLKLRLEAAQSRFRWRAIPNISRPAAPIFCFKALRHNTGFDDIVV